jgi:hypothetical protein
LIGTAVWSIIYLVIKHSKIHKLLIKGAEDKDIKDLDNRMVSFLHGFGALLLSGYHCVLIRTTCGELNSVYQRNVMIFSVSYFAYDLIAMAFEGILDVAMFIHHPLCIFGFTLPLYENISGNYAMMALLSSEISNPPMHLRQMMRLTGRRYTKAYEFSEITFIMLYFFGRIIIAVPIAYSNLVCPVNHIIFKLTCVGLMTQSAFFGLQMIQVLRKRLSEILQRKNMGIKLNWFEILDSAQIEKL